MAPILYRACQSRNFLMCRGRRIPSPAGAEMRRSTGELTVPSQLKPVRHLGLPFCGVLFPSSLSRLVRTERTTAALNNKPRAVLRAEFEAAAPVSLAQNGRAGTGARALLECVWCVCGCVSGGPLPCLVSSRLVSLGRRLEKGEGGARGDLYTANDQGREGERVRSATAGGRAVKSLDKLTGRPAGRQMGSVGGGTPVCLWVALRARCDAGWWW